MEVWKINFNGGDDLYYRGHRIIRFRAGMMSWQKFLREVLEQLEIDAIVVFGNGRRSHRIAARLAKAENIPFWVFEEGYIRPDYITLEQDGVNADSPIASLSLDDIQDIGEPKKERIFRNSFRMMAWYSFFYFLAGIVLQPRYRNYRHHKPFSVLEGLLWLRAGYRKIKYRWLERRVVRTLLLDGHPRFFLVPLQVYNDSQVRLYSPWRRIENFLEWVIYSFANNAPAGDVLVIKHHPMDRGHTDYSDVIARLANEMNVVDRVIYIHDVHLPSLLHRCTGVVTLNSTVGLQALYHNVPVRTLGRCFYDKPGLTYQGSLDSFWIDPCRVDSRLYRRFRAYLINKTQINDSFYGSCDVGRREMG